MGLLHCSYCNFMRTCVKQNVSWYIVQNSEPVRTAPRALERRFCLGHLLFNLQLAIHAAAFASADGSALCGFSTAETMLYFLCMKAREACGSNTIIYIIFHYVSKGHGRTGQRSCSLDCSGMMLSE